MMSKRSIRLRFPITFREISNRSAGMMRGFGSAIMSLMDRAVRMSRPWMVSIAILLLLTACDRSPSSGVRTITVPTHPVAQLRPITQLQPNRVTHIAVDRLGNVLCTAESEKGLDGVLIVGENGLPRATELTSVNILAELGETIGGSGTIQDLVIGGDGQIYFYFVGGKDRRIRACVGRFDVRRANITILVRTDALKQVSTMGDSIALARGTLLPEADRMHLWLRHFDSWALLGFELHPTRPTPEAELTPTFTRVVGDGEELKLAQSRYTLAAGPGKDFLLMDSLTGTLWQVDPTGKATVRAPLNGLPSELSLPMVLDEKKLLLFAADSPPVGGEIQEFVRRSTPKTAYPAFITIDGKEVSTLGRDDMHAFSGFPIYTMRLHQLLKAPDGSIVSFDQASGQLMRITITQE